MTTSQPVPPLAPDELVSTGSEREVLETFLDLYRAVVRRKLAGVDEEQSRRRLVPSLTTLAGIAKHLASGSTADSATGQPAARTAEVEVRSPAAAGGRRRDDDVVAGAFRHRCQR
jgi:hypothetical protein